MNSKLKQPRLIAPYKIDAKKPLRLKIRNISGDETIQVFE
jgi:hypothetical protein